MGTKIYIRDIVLAHFDHLAACTRALNSAGRLPTAHQVLINEAVKAMAGGADAMAKFLSQFNGTADAVQDYQSLVSGK